MNKKQKRLVRMIAIVLAALLVFSAVISAVISIAYAEEAPANQCELTMEYLNEEQALRMSQRLVYSNASGRKLDRVVFYAPANMFRRQSALFYEGDNLNKAFPNGYLPGGIDLTSVRVNGSKADWGYQGKDETFLRVACNLESGESCEFVFDYYLLLTANGAFMGVSEGECRLSDFYFAPAATDTEGEFILNMATSYTRYIDTPAADYTATITLPDALILTTGGAESHTEGTNKTRTWTVQANDVHDFAMIISQGLNERTTSTASGVEVRLRTDVKKNASQVLQTAV